MQERRVRRVFTPEQKFEIAGTTRRGISGLMHLGRDWLIVREALELPELDTSWMSDPLLREYCTDWLNKK